MRRLSFLVASIAVLISVSAAVLDGAESGTPLQLKAALVSVGNVGGNVRDNTGGNGSVSVELFALRRIFDILGIPYDFLSDSGKLREYRVAFTGGALLNNAVSPGLMNDLYDFVEGGGVLVAAGETGNRMYPLFGIERQVPARRRYRMTFVGQALARPDLEELDPDLNDPDLNDPALRYIDHPNERTISLGNGEKHFFDDVIWSYGSSLSSQATQLAVFDDGSVGFSVHPYGRGRAYLLGLSYTESVLLPQIGRDCEAQRRFVNSFEPSADVIMLLLRAVCESSCSPFVHLSTVPYALPAALVLTHDVDAQTSFMDSLKFAALEESYGVKSTFFVTTKFFKDETDIDYFNLRENLGAVAELRKGGWDIGSHTVAHSQKLASAPEGDRNSEFRTYRPVERLTVRGEVLVSKELLDRSIPGQNTVAFRAGYLEFPPVLLRTLEEAGYLYDSTFSANDVLSAFPYMGLRERNLGSPESKVVEIPVTLDESVGFLTPKNVDSVVRTWLDVIGENAKNGAFSVLLIHPSDTRTESYKLRAQEGVMKAVAAMGGWMGDLSTFGAFWRSRSTLRFTAALGGDGTLLIRINGKDGTLDPAVGFTVGGGQVARVIVMDGDGKILDYRTVHRNGRLYVGRAREPAPSR